MTERLKLSLGGMWMIAGLSAVILPVFLPSFPTVGIAGNPIAIALVSMFFLSLPSSLVAIPLAFFIDAAFGIAYTPIASMYLYVVTFFVLGSVQWFWLVPRVFGGNSIVQPLDLSESTVGMGLPESKNDSIYRLDVDGMTPLERVLIQDAKRSL